MFCRNPQNGRYVWIEFFIAVAHYLLWALDLLSIGVVVLHLQRSSCWKKYTICIDKRIAVLELLTQRRKLRSQFPYLLCKFGIVREFVSKPLFYFCIQQFHQTSATRNLKSFEKRTQLTWKESTSLKCFSSQFIHLVFSWFYLNKSDFFQGLFSKYIIYFENNPWKKS